MVGVAPTGGKLPTPMRRHVLEAIQHGWTIESGLHDFLCEDEEFAVAARESDAVLKDFRKNSERDVAMRQGLRAECLRLHTVGHDCSVGKMARNLRVLNPKLIRSYIGKQKEKILDAKLTKQIVHQLEQRCRNVEW